MTPKILAKELSKNRSIIESIFTDITEDFIQYKTSKASWSPLEVICHLVDEEKEDFRARIKHIINHPETPPPAIDPEGWVISRAYADQDFESKRMEWSKERAFSIDYLHEIDKINLGLGFDHQNFGRFDIQFLLVNWLAHDLLHIRQLTRLRYNYLAYSESNPTEYAGKW